MYPTTRDHANRSDGRKWTTDEPCDGSIHLVSCEDGTTGLVRVRWVNLTPHFYGPVFNQADFDEHGNSWGVEILDANPRY